MKMNLRLLLVLALLVFGVFAITACNTDNDGGVIEDSPAGVEDPSVRDDSLLDDDEQALDLNNDGVIDDSESLNNDDMLDDNGLGEDDDMLDDNGLGEDDDLLDDNGLGEDDDLLEDDAGAITQ